MLSPKQLVTALLCLFVLSKINAQEIPDKLPTLIVNEVHNDTADDGDFFIEFVVLETNKVPYDKTSTGPRIIVDDSNTYPDAQPGFITIDPEVLKSVTKGDVIVVHSQSTDISNVDPSVVLLNVNSPKIGKWIGAPDLH